MLNFRTFEQSISRVWLFLIIIALLIGIFFRFANLAHKVYWHDEVYTSLRAAGYTRQEIDQELFQNKVIAAKELQKFQNIKPSSKAVDTISSLALEDPQHPPLYFLLARFWMQMFGASLTASRSLPVLLSLCGLPLIYKLSLVLFDSQLTALLGTVLFALSPFDVLFAQTARQYSLLTVAIIGSSYCLLVALRKSTWRNWLLYALVSVIGLYTHPFFGLTLIAHSVYVLLLLFLIKIFNYEKKPGIWWKYLLPIVAILGLYSPWLFVLVTNYQRVLDTTDWARVPVNKLELSKLWILSFTSLFFDLDFGFNNIVTYLPRFVILLLIIAALYLVVIKTKIETWLFIITTTFVPFLILALPDILLGGKRSGVTRYLISCFPSLQLAVAYLLANKLLSGQVIWRGIIVLLFTGSILSCTVSAFSDTWWNKDLSYFNSVVAKAINNSPDQLVVSEIGEDFTNTGDLISLSYNLSQDVQMLLLAKPFNIQLLQPYSAPLIFRPSQQLLQTFELKKIKLETVIESGRLWRVKPSLSHKIKFKNSRFLDFSNSNEPQNKY